MHDAHGAIGEVVGALAVVVTLLLLVRQMRQNSAALRTQTYDSIMRGWNELNMVVATRPEMADLMTRGQDDPDSLEGTERVQFVFLLASYFNQFEKLLYLFEAGTLSNEEWHRWASIGAQILSTPGGRAWRVQSPGFSRLFEELDRHRTGDSVATDRLRSVEQRDV